VEARNYQRFERVIQGELLFFSLSLEHPPACCVLEDRRKPERPDFQEFRRDVASDQHERSEVTTQKSASAKFPLFLLTT
jgi:hypothetical protein